MACTNGNAKAYHTVAAAWQGWSESGSVAQASGHAGVSFTLYIDTARS